MAILDHIVACSERAAVSGYETAVRSYLEEELRPLVDELKTDRLGNLLAYKRGSGTGTERIMLAAHMDEIGLMVSGIDRGFLRFVPVGGIDPRILPNQRVVVHGRRTLPGLIGSRPPHVVPPDQRNRTIPISELFVDVGLPAEELADLVRSGDSISFDQTTIALNDTYATGKALDNRVSLAILVETLAALQGVDHLWDLYAVVTVQEEIGLRGAMVATFSVAPTIGIALDVTFAHQPGVTGDETLPWGEGPAVGLGPNLHPRLRELLVQSAERREIPLVDEILPGHSGTDAWAMQVTRAGVPTALLSVPIRNMHSPVETVRLQDAERTVRLLAGFVSDLDGETVAQLAFDDGEYV